ncbi:MAG: riboflavin biosynthesis protein RibF [Lentisphaeria bacterium]|nr:riboflavin biosynthesis protein RibF [Lentisphaeria bacterium]
MDYIEKPHCAPARIVAGIGVFDGVHLGHRAILRTVHQMAAETGALPAVVTFAPHPRAVLFPDEPPRLLMPQEKRFSMLKQDGLLCWVIRFTRGLADLSPEEFFEELLHFDGCELAGICVGTNWRFGKRGRGDCAFLTEHCAKQNIRFSAVPLVELNDMTVSSSAIRSAVTAGRLNEAKAMLGRSFRLYGKVVHGFRDATEKLSCPTANLEISGGVLPPDGVYIGAVELEGKRYPAAVNIGFSPTFKRERQERRTEVHILDFNGSLYCGELEVELLAFLREERTFADPEKLKEQIFRDLAGIYNYFETEEEHHE